MHVLQYFEHQPDPDFPESLKIDDLVDVQSTVKHAKMDEIKIFQKKNIEKLVLELLFDIGFIRIHQRARFL